MDKALCFKMQLVMRISAVLLLMGMLHVSAAGWGQTISLSAKNISLREAFDSIEKRTNYFFLYEDALLDGTRRFDIDLRDAAIGEVLTVCFRDQPLSWQLFGHNIVVKRKLPHNAKPNPDLRGRVVNERGDPLPGVSITLKGNRYGTTTDQDGYFSLQLGVGDSIVIFSGANVETKEWK